jgi:hypothetical protein
MWERWATFFLIYIKSTIYLINKEIVLFFRVTNWFLTVKNSAITIINFPRKRYHFENTFLDHLSHCYGRDGSHRFCIYGGHKPAKFRLLSQFLEHIFEKCALLKSLCHLSVCRLFFGRCCT